MEKKYSIVKEDSIEFNGHTLYRIRAERDIPEHWVTKGDIGGYIEKEDNLSQEGDCFVNNNAKVYGESKFTNEAYACGDAVVKNIITDETFFSDNSITFADEVSTIKGSAMIMGDARVQFKTPVCELGDGSDIGGNVVVVIFPKSCTISDSQIALNEFNFDYEE